jgi:hypothetical protein
MRPPPITIRSVPFHDGSRKEPANHDGKLAGELFDDGMDEAGHHRIVTGQELVELGL